MIKRLQTSGSFNPEKLDKPEEIPHYLDRPAMLVYVGNFESMDGSVEVKEEHINRLCEMHNSMLSRVTRLATGEVPLKFCPPIQLDHSLSAKDTVGRLVGDLSVGEHEAEPGLKVKALMGVVRVLGKENVEKVIDGRWTNLSIGADLETGKLSELTITPFPAAPDASMLSRLGAKTEKYNGVTMKVTKAVDMAWYLEVGDIKRGPFQKEEDAFLEGRQVIDSGVLNKLSKGDTMLKRLKAFLVRTMKLSENEVEEKMKHMSEEEKTKHLEEEKKEHERLKKHLTGVKKMTDEDADKHLSDMNQEDVKKLSEEVNEHEKKLAAEAAQPYAGKETPEEERLEPTHRMAKLKEEMTKLSAGFRTASDGVKLSQKKANIAVRLSRLRSDAKITPAEIKKINLAKLAGESEATIEAVIKSYEDREPVILAGLMGSTREANIADVHKQMRMSKLEQEVRSNMSLLKHTVKSPTNLGAEAVEPKHTPEEMSQMPHAEHLKHMEMELTEVNKLLDEGKIPEAKEKIKAWSGRYMSPAAQHAGAEQVHQEMSGLAESVKCMQNEFEKVIQLMSTVVGSGK